MRVRDVKILMWCDFHLEAEDKRVEGFTTDAIRVGGRRGKTVEVCGECYAKYIEPLVNMLDRRGVDAPDVGIKGRPKGSTKVASQQERREALSGPRPGQPELFMDSSQPTAREKKERGWDHVSRAKEPWVCPFCEDKLKFSSVSMHLMGKHGASRYEHPAVCPECGTYKDPRQQAMLMHRVRSHGFSVVPLMLAEVEARRKVQAVS